MLHLSHPAYPTNAQISAEDRAIDRDIRDAELIGAWAGIVTTAADALIPLMRPLEHPQAEWHPDRLMEALQEAMVSIKAESDRLRGPLFIDEDC